MSPPEFGVIPPQGWRLDLPEISPAEQWGLITEISRTAEKLGFHSIWLYDHFHTVPTVEERSCFECWSTLTALSQHTSKIKLGQIVTCNSYRNPAYLAKISSILDVISNGRLILGIGAGWYEHEYKGYGYPFPPPKERILMMGEAIKIIKSMWMDRTTTFHGKYYHLKNAYNYPKPVQKPRPKILVGGMGKQYTLRITAMEADIWNGYGPLSTYMEALDALKRHCSQIGRDINDIQISVRLDIVVSDTESKAEELAGSHGITRDKWDKVIVGSPKGVYDLLRKYLDIGVTLFILYFIPPTKLEPLELFEEEVLPRFSK